ncbi:hypothetical protein ACS0TY_018834 [Phlomoides rotata]
MDAKLVVDAFNDKLVGSSSVFGDIIDACKNSFEAYPFCKVVWVVREANYMAHHLAKIARNFPSPFIWNELPFDFFDIGPSNLKRKRNFVTIPSIKGLFNKEKALGGQNETPQKSKGDANTLSSGAKTRSQTTQNDLTIESVDTLPNLATGQASEPEHETSPIPPTETDQHASSEDAAATTAASSKKRSRGPTSGKGIRKYFDSFGKMKINVDPTIGRPVNGEQSAKLASNIGIVTRDVLPIHMDVNIDTPGVKRSLVERMEISTRQSRYKLHKHFLKYANAQEAKNNKPSFCPDKEN